MAKLLWVMIKTVVSLVLVIAFVLGCVAWAGHGGIANVYLAQASWLLVTIIVLAACGLGWCGFALALAGACLTVLIWSQVLVSFEAHWFERAPIYVQWLFVLLPLLIGVLIGLIQGKDGMLAAALTLSLGSIGLFPIQIWNVQSRVEGGWQEWPSPAGGPYGVFMGAVIAYFLGAVAGWLGERLRTRLRRQTS